MDLAGKQLLPQGREAGAREGGREGGRADFLAASDGQKLGPQPLLTVWHLSGRTLYPVIPPHPDSIVVL